MDFVIKDFPRLMPHIWQKMWEYGIGEPLHLHDDVYTASERAYDIYKMAFPDNVFPYEKKYKQLKSQEL